VNDRLSSWVFRDSAVENLREFFERFRRLTIRSSPELDALVEQAEPDTAGYWWADMGPVDGPVPGPSGAAPDGHGRLPVQSPV